MPVGELGDDLKEFILRFIYCLFFADDSWARDCDLDPNQEIDSYIQKLYYTAERAPRSVSSREQDLQNSICIYIKDRNYAGYRQELGTVIDPAYTGAQVKELITKVVPHLVDLVAQGSYRPIMSLVECKEILESMKWGMDRWNSWV